MSIALLLNMFFNSIRHLTVQMGKSLLLEPKLSKQDMGEKAGLASNIVKLG